MPYKTDKDENILTDSEVPWTSGGQAGIVVDINEVKDGH